MPTLCSVSVSEWGRDFDVDSVVEYLELDDLLSLASSLFGSPPPVRDLGLLGSAAARPSTTAFGSDAYPDIWTKAAALLQSIVTNHSLVDGNKRLGWVSTAVFLEINGRSVATASNDSVYELVMQIAASGLEVEDIAARLSALVRE